MRTDTGFDSPGPFEALIDPRTAGCTCGWPSSRPSWTGLREETCMPPEVLRECERQLAGLDAARPCCSRARRAGAGWPRPRLSRGHRAQ